MRSSQQADSGLLYFFEPHTIPDADLQGFIEEKAKDLRGPWRPLVSPGGVLQRVICKERKHFVDTCFAFEFNEHSIADHILVFLLAMQNPLATVFLKCYLNEGPWESGLPDYTGDDLEFVNGTQLFEEQEDVFMQHVSFRGSVVAPYGQRFDAHVFCSQFPPAPPSSSSASGSRLRETDAIVEQIMTKLPWLTEADVREYLQSSRRPSATPIADRADDGPSGEAVAPPLDLAEDAAIDLAGIRDRVEAEDEGDDAHAHFYPKVLGGAWTAAHAGVLYDRIACMARAHTIEFRRVFHLPQMQSFSLVAYGGEHHCHMLVSGLGEEEHILLQFVDKQGIARRVVFR